MKLTKTEITAIIGIALLTSAFSTSSFVLLSGRFYIGGLALLGLNALPAWIASLLFSRKRFV